VACRDITPAIASPLALLPKERKAFGTGAAFCVHRQTPSPMMSWNITSDPAPTVYVRRAVTSPTPPRRTSHAGKIPGALRAATCVKMTHVGNNTIALVAKAGNASAFDWCPCCWLLGPRLCCYVCSLSCVRWARRVHARLVLCSMYRRPDI
jgi:hypothetical protein